MSVTMTCSVQRETQAALMRQLDVLRHLPKQKFAIARKAAGEVKKFSSGRVREQQALSGAGFTPRSSKRTRYRKNDDGSWRKKRRMLENLGKAQNMAVYRDGEAVAVGWQKSGKRNRFDVVAYKHQHGKDDQLGVTPGMKAGLNKWHVRQRHNKATRRMAQALLRNGYRLPVRGENGKVRLKRVPAKWIMEHMTQIRAAWVLRMLVRADVSKNSPKKEKPQTWDVHLPARPFLGVSDQESQALLASMSQQILREIKGK